MTRVEGAEERENTQVQRKGTFLFIFPTTWWETISERHIGNDIHITTTKEIRHVYLNGSRMRDVKQETDVACHTNDGESKAL